MINTRPWKMTSQYHGRCKSCGVPYSIGDEIFYSKDYGAQCLDCGQSTLDLLRPQSTYVGADEYRSAFCEEANSHALYLTCAKELRSGRVLCPNCHGWVPHHDPAGRAAQYCANCGTEFTYASSLRAVADWIDPLPDVPLTTPEEDT